MYCIGRISQKWLLFLAALGVLTACVGVACSSGSLQKAAAAGVALSADTDQGRGEFLASYGWQVTTVPEQVEQVTIPAEWNEAYRRYNDLQQAQGFDLRSFKGQTVKRYTYRVNNYPDTTQPVHANLLVFDGQVIGGDLCTWALDGFMHGFSVEQTGVTKPVLYQVSA